MKTKILIIMLGFVSYIVVHYSLISYENTKAHTSLNNYFVKFLEEFVNKEFENELFLKLSDDLLGSLPGPGVTNSGYFEYTTSESILELSPKQWIEHGGYSADEPELPAAVRHFYDPVGLKGGKKYLTNRGTYWEGVYPNPETDAIEWALGDTPKGESNNWSAKKGKEYFLKAISEPDELKKKEYLAKAWRCLGEVLHNTADMLCPPHVRNDSHAAPLGWAGGWVLGSPDAYEEMFNPVWVRSLYNEKPDPDLWNSIRDVETIREVNQKLAAFTNANFFSGETISGMGVKLIKPANGENAYSSPKLEKLEYEEDNFTYFKQFASGRRVKMCKDHSYFNFRGYPYIDLECAKSQASELIPNFMWASLKIFTLYIPFFEIYIDEIDGDGKIIGYVTQRESEEYQNVEKYNGAVAIVVGNKIYNATCKNGKFEQQVSKQEIIVPDNDITANISLGGLLFKSPKFNCADFSRYKNFRTDLWVEFMNNDDDISIIGNFSFESNTNKIKWNLNKGTFSEKQEKNKEIKICDFDLIMSSDGIYAESININYFYDDQYEDEGFDLSTKKELTLSLKNKNNLLRFFSTPKFLTVSGDYFRKTIDKIYYKITENKALYDKDYNITGVKTVVKEYELLNPESKYGERFTFELIE